MPKAYPPYTGDQPHATARRYQAGCRCDGCRVANTLRMRDWRAGKKERARQDAIDAEVQARVDRREAERAEIRAEVLEELADEMRAGFIRLNMEAAPANAAKAVA